VIKPPSLQNVYSLVSSSDPSLKLPADEKEREEAIQRARETGRWDDLILEGEIPTRFEVRPLTGSALEWWRGELARKQLSHSEAAALILRLALVDVSGLGEHKVRHSLVDGHKLATTEIVDAIYAAAGGEGAGIVLELGVAIAQRASESPSPK
jgi:hypothetical protein